MKHSGESGLTLAEVLVASAVLAMGILPLFHIASGTFRRVRVERPELMATQLAAEVMDQLRLVPFKDFKMGGAGRIRVRLAPGSDNGRLFADRRRRIPLLLGNYPDVCDLDVHIEPIVADGHLAEITVTITTAPEASPDSRPSTFVLREWVEDRLLRPGQ